MKKTNKQPKKDTDNRNVSVLITGISGSGKSAIAQIIAEAVVKQPEQEFTQAQKEAIPVLEIINKRIDDGLENYLKPKPVEPHAELKAMYQQQICQVRNDDTGKDKIMTREAARKLYKELGDTVYWNVHDTPDCYREPITTFDSAYLYTYKRKANLVKLDGKFMTREAAIAEWESKKDTCDVYVTSLNLSGEFVKVRDVQDGQQAPVFHDTRDSGKFEYELRERPLKQISWKDVPVGATVVPLFSPDRVLIYRGCNDDLLACERINAANFPVTEAYAPKVIKLALASEQPWIAVQDARDYGKDKVEGLIYLWRGNHIYRITGIAEGYKI